MARYLVLAASCDSVNYNHNAVRFLWTMVRSAVVAQGLPAVVLVTMNRCDGHQGNIALKPVCKLTQTLVPMFSLANLMRFMSYREKLLRGILKVLQSRAQLVREEPPFETKQYFEDFIYHTVLRNAAVSEHSGNPGRTSAAQRRSRALTEVAVRAGMDMIGYKAADGMIYIYVGDRDRSRLALIDATHEDFEFLLFRSLPAVPAANRWLTLTPMASWTALLSGFLSVGAEGFLIAFDGHEEYPADFAIDGLGLGADDVFKVLRGKRMKAAKDKFLPGAVLSYLLHMLVLLMVSRCVERYIGLHIRDVGPMWHLDYTLARRNAGREEEPLWNPAANGTDGSFEPTLWNIFKDDLKPIRNMIRDLARILLGSKRLPDPSGNGLSFHENVQSVFQRFR